MATSVTYNPSILVESFVENEIFDKHEKIGFKHFQPIKEKQSIVVIEIDKNRTIRASVRDARALGRLKHRARKPSVRETNRLNREVKIGKREPVLVTIHGKSRFVSTDNATHTREDFLNAIKIAAKQGNEHLEILARD